MNNILYIERIQQVAEEQLKYISEYGYAKPGVNGPYKFVDTPVRNSAHWCCTFAFLYRKTKEEKYLNTVRVLADYLVTEQKKSVSGAIQCMSGEHFDCLNGLIGQAWAIEGLVAAAVVLSNSTYLESAINIFCSQKFDYDRGRWERIELTGENIGDDPTFNHQLWFAASGTLILQQKRVEEVHKQVVVFLDKCMQNFDTYNNGLIKHYGPFEKKYSVMGRMKRTIKNLLPRNVFWKLDPDKYCLKCYESAYHIFNMYGFAIMYNYFNTHSFFKSEKFNQALKYLGEIQFMNYMFNVDRYVKRKATDDLLQNRRISKYAYPYNSPCFEYGYVMSVFGRECDSEIIKSLWEIQDNVTYCIDSKNYARNTNDPATLTARIYEFTRYIDIEG